MFFSLARGAWGEAPARFMGGVGAGGAALLLLLGCAAKAEPSPRGEVPLLTPVAQRVTATVQREAARLVRLETEHEAFLTTPEHPFATPGSGWTGAGRLVPGDWVVSERFRAVRLLSVHSEPAARPVPVFNLSVASSHAYFVGTDRVLVHNTKCQPNPLESREERMERLTRELAEVRRQIRALTRTAGPSHQLTELKVQRRRLRRRLNGLREAARKKQGVVLPSRRERERQRDEAEYDAARTAFEEAQEEFAALDSRLPNSDPDRIALEARSRARKRMVALKISYDRTQRILELARELAEREGDPPATEGDAQTLEKGKQELRAKLMLERKRRAAMKDMRRKRADPIWLEEQGRGRGRRPHGLRLLADLADTEHGRLELTPPLDSAESTREDAPEAVLDEAHDVEEALNEREEPMQQRSSPALAAELESSYERLQQELRAERAAVDVALSALAREQAHIRADQAGSSTGPTWQERLRALQEEQVQLRAQWRAALEQRLDHVRRQLQVRRSVFALRDSAIEAERVREIALLERELQDPRYR